jgi:hypothetical protein
VITSIFDLSAKGGLARTAADGVQAPDSSLDFGHEAWPTSMAPDGRTLLLYGAVEGDQGDLFTRDWDSHKERRIALPGFQRGGRFSPGGDRIAYQSDESGRWEIYVQPWPSLDARIAVSVNGGTEPVWSPDGRELYFRNGDQVMAAALGPGRTIAPPRVLFRGPYLYDLYGDQSWDVMRDGRFVMMKPVGQARFEVRIVKHWLRLVERDSLVGQQ